MLKLIPRALKPHQLQPCTCAATRHTPSSKAFSSTSTPLDASSPSSPPAPAPATLAERLAARYTKSNGPASTADAADINRDTAATASLTNLIASILSPPQPTADPRLPRSVPYKPVAARTTPAKGKNFDYRPKERKINIASGEAPQRGPTRLEAQRIKVERPESRVTPQVSKKATRPTVQATKLEKVVEEPAMKAAKVARAPKIAVHPNAAVGMNLRTRKQNERTEANLMRSPRGQILFMVIPPWAEATEEERARWIEMENLALARAIEQQALADNYVVPTPTSDPTPSQPDVDATITEGVETISPPSTASVSKPERQKSQRPKVTAYMKKLMRQSPEELAEGRYISRQKKLHEQYAAFHGADALATVLKDREAALMEASDVAPTTLPTFAYKFKAGTPTSLPVDSTSATSPEPSSSTATPPPTSTGQTKRPPSFRKPKITTTSAPITPPSPNPLDLVLPSLAPLPPISSYPSVLSASSIKFTPLTNPMTSAVPIARLAHGLDRVLFNPGVHFVQDPRSGVYNFPPSLQTLPTVAAFAFDKLPQYITSSKDPKLMEIAEENKKTFVSSTSSTVGMLCQIYFWLSKGKGINTSMLSSHFANESPQFGMGQRLPASVIMHENEGRYAIDADKSFDGGIDNNILASYGHLMEKLLTTEPEEFSGFLVDSPNPARSQAGDKQAYHYTMTDHLVLRSQLDAHNEHLPNVSFDVKTRGTIAIRQDRLNYVAAAGYSLDRLVGPFHSYEREYYDLIRSAFLKYSFQVRIGAMDGCFLAYHSTASFFGFQYIPITEMDQALYGDSRDGEYVFNLCVAFLEKILIDAKDCYPGQSTKLTFAADTEADVLRIFASPLIEDASKPPMMLLELRGTNYINDVATRQVEVFKGIAADDTKDTPAPRWDVGYRIDKYTGEESVVDAEGTIIDTAYIATQFSTVRDFQTMFDTLALPIGVTVNDIKKAAARAAIVDAEVTPDDIAMGLKFPTLLGIQYKNKPSKGVQNLRRMAARVRSVLEKNANEEKKKVVQLRTVMQTEETEA